MSQQIAPSSTTLLASFMLTTCLGVTYIDPEASAGISTWYAKIDGPTTCGHNENIDTSTFPYGYYGQCGNTVWDNGYGCGKCYEITCIGPKDKQNTNCACSSTTPSVIISCNDYCAHCPDTEFTLTQLSMARILNNGQDDLDSGVCHTIKTSVRRVACEYESNIKIIPKGGSSQFWYGLYIANVNGYGAIKSVELKPPQSDYYPTTCDKEFNPDYWYCSGGIPLTVPMTVKLTNEANEVSIYPNCINTFEDDVVFDCGRNFDGQYGEEKPEVIPAPEAMKMQPPYAVRSPTTQAETCGGKNIKFKMHTSSQLYWLAFYLEDVCEYCGTVYTVKVRDSSEFSEWVWGWLTADDEFGYWYFDDVKESHGGEAWTAPISVRLEGTAGTLTFPDVMRSVNGGWTYYSHKSFCRMEHETTTAAPKNGCHGRMSWGILFGLVVIFVFH